MKKRHKRKRVKLAGGRTEDAGELTPAKDGNAVRLSFGPLNLWRYFVGLL